MTIPTDTLGRTIWWLENRETDAKQTLAKFITRFGEDPHNAFRWGSNAVDAAARLRLIQRALRFLRGEVSPDFTGDRLEALRSEWQRDLLRLARSQRQSSTSQLANVAEEAERVALAHLLEDLGPGEPKLAPDAVELRDAIVKDLTEAQAVAQANSLSARTQKDQRYREGVTEGYRRSRVLVENWRPKED